MSKILFSIVTPTYNRLASGYLQECIDSIRSQEKSDFDYEHIIVDDGSVDGTQKYLKELAKIDKNIKYVYQVNGGPAKAVHTGIDNAKGDYIVIIGDDDLLTPDSLKKRLEYINAHPKIDWFYALAEWIDEFGLPTEQLFQSRQYDDLHYERELISPYMHGGTLTVKRTALADIFWPDWLNRSEDYFLWLELLRPERKLNFGFQEEVVFKYRYHSQSYTAKLDSEEKKRAKDELNLRIKSLHPKNIVFLAEEAYGWSKETAKMKKYYSEQIKQIAPLEQKVKALEDKINSFYVSKYIGPVIRLRSKKNAYAAKATRGVSKMAGKALSGRRRIKRIIDGKPVAVPPVRYIENQSWPADRPLVSVITPFFNREDTMPTTIRSVLGQSFQDFEYIVVDDGSTKPEAVAYLKQIKHSKIKVVYQNNQGVAAARNTGIAQAKGKYILCLDSDDLIDKTYLEKAVVVLESNPNVSLVTFDMQMFGALQDKYTYPPFDPHVLIRDNIMLTASVFDKRAWEAAGGYKNAIGYEDWEFWVNVTEHGYFAKHIGESLFKYRTAELSRYIDDQENHNNNMRYIRRSHPDYKKTIIKKVAEKSVNQLAIKPATAFVNLRQKQTYIRNTNVNKNALLVVPWMTFGGAETLILNFCRELSADNNLSFVTGLQSVHEWEYKFKEITPDIYHLANLFDDNKQLYLEFISNYIETRDIEVIHIIHTNFIFDILPEIKKRHPHVRVILTMFNDRVPEYFQPSVDLHNYIDVYTSDNNATANHYKRELPPSTSVKVIPNGINCYDIFNPALFSRDDWRKNLKVRKDELAIFFVGRLSEEKNPDVFLAAAEAILHADAGSKVRFFIIGDGGMRPQVERAISRIGSKKIVYLGYQAEVAHFLSAADVFVLPSSIEGFPLSILEAMAMKVCVIASDVGAVTDVIETKSDGFVIAPGSVEEIVSTIKKLVKDREQLELIKNSARVKVEQRYSNKLLGQNYRKLYKDVIK